MFFEKKREISLNTHTLPFFREGYKYIVSIYMQLSGDIFGVDKMFVKTVREKDPVKSDQEKVTKTVDILNVGLAIVFLLIILGAAFYANSIEWDAASTALLTAFTGGAGIVVGALIGESTGSTESSGSKPPAE